jgi:hypothetical protein
LVRFDTEGDRDYWHCAQDGICSQLFCLPSRFAAGDCYIRFGLSPVSQGRAHVEIRWRWRAWGPCVQTLCGPPYLLLSGLKYSMESSH